MLDTRLSSVGLILPRIVPSPKTSSSNSNMMARLRMLQLLDDSTIPLDHPMRFVFFSTRRKNLLNDRDIIHQCRSEKVPTTILRVSVSKCMGPKDGPKVKLVVSGASSALGDLVCRLVRHCASLPIGRAGYKCTYDSRCD